MTVAASIVAFFASAKGLQDGRPVPVIAVTSTAANVSGIVGGLVVFGDPVPGQPVGHRVQALAFALVLLAAWFTAGAWHARRPADRVLTARRACIPSSPVIRLIVQSEAALQIFD